MRFRRQGGGDGGLTFALPGEVCCWLGARAGCLARKALIRSEVTLEIEYGALTTALLLPAPPLLRAEALRWFLRFRKWALPGWPWQWSSACQPSPHSVHSVAGQSHT